jgi:hypothetical protein
MKKLITEKNLSTKLKSHETTMNIIIIIILQKYNSNNIKNII